MNSKVVLDASALLCLLNGERGADKVSEVLTRSVVGAANLAEVVSKLRERGLSLGDRACLALAMDLDAALYTTDTDLARADVGIGITHVRS